ncbi:hypothetical protein DFJ74DRAFT_725132 [Hyaloraphidium curvatum]|nr:hypothetical protein DFJ74DRAFT_725132 [Hyaloraphidium curvatum]
MTSLRTSYVRLDSVGRPVAVSLKGGSRVVDLAASDAGLLTRVRQNGGSAVPGPAGECLCPFPECHEDWAGTLNALHKHYGSHHRGTSDLDLSDLRLVVAVLAADTRVAVAQLPPRIGGAVHLARLRGLTAQGIPLDTSGLPHPLSAVPTPHHLPLVLTSDGPQHGAFVPSYPPAAPHHLGGAIIAHPFLPAPSPFGAPLSFPALVPGAMLHTSEINHSLAARMAELEHQRDVGASVVADLVSQVAALQRAQAAPVVPMVDTAVQDDVDELKCATALLAAGLAEVRSAGLQMALETRALRVDAELSSARLDMVTDQVDMVSEKVDAVSDGVKVVGAKFEMLNEKVDDLEAKLAAVTLYLDSLPAKYRQGPATALSHAIQPDDGVLEAVGDGRDLLRARAAELDELENRLEKLAIEEKVEAVDLDDLIAVAESSEEAEDWEDVPAEEPGDGDEDVDHPDDPEFEVEAIMGHRKAGRRIKYRIRFAGYDSNYDMYLPEENGSFLISCSASVPCFRRPPGTGGGGCGSSSEVSEPGRAGRGALTSPRSNVISGLPNRTGADDGLRAPGLPLRHGALLLRAVYNALLLSLDCLISARHWLGRGQRQDVNFVLTGLSPPSPHILPVLTLRTLLTRDRAVCTGSLILAKTSLLRQRRATSNKAVMAMPGLEGSKVAQREISAGSVVSSIMTAWSDYQVLRKDQIDAMEVYRMIVGCPDDGKGGDGNVPLSYYVGPLGSPGLTAFVGLFHNFDPPRSGETLFVSGAAGAVGQCVVVLCKMVVPGLRVVGSAGTDEKCAYIRDNLGIDAVFNYKKRPTPEALAELCPNGIDFMFDNDR